MTRNIGEPSISKEQGSQDFGIRQLFRRPAPVSSGDLIQYFRAYRYVSNIVRSSGGSRTLVLWDFWEYCDTDVFSPLDGTGNPPDPGVDQLQEVVLEAAGRYTIYFGARAFPVANGSVELAMHDDDSTWGEPDVVYHVANTAYGGGFMVLQVDRVYPIADPAGGTPATPIIAFTVAQITGSNMIFNPLWMEIQYEPNVNFCEPGSS